MTEQESKEWFERNPKTVPPQGTYGVAISTEEMYQAFAARFKAENPLTLEEWND